MSRKNEHVLRDRHIGLVRIFIRICRITFRRIFRSRCEIFECRSCIESKLSYLDFSKQKFTLISIFTDAEDLTLISIEFTFYFFLILRIISKLNQD